MVAHGLNSHPQNGHAFRLLSYRGQPGLQFPHIAAHSGASCWALAICHSLGAGDAQPLGFDHGYFFGVKRSQACGDKRSSPSKINRSHSPGGSLGPTAIRRQRSKESLGSLVVASA